MHEKHTVLLGDAHQIVLESIARILQDEFELAGTARKGDDLVRMTEELHPRIVIVAVSLPLLNGIEATRRIRQSSPGTKIIILTQYADREYMRAAFAAGASAYVLKKGTAAELIEAIREALEDRFYVSKALLEGGEIRLFDPQVNPGGLLGGNLTPRQYEVMQLVAEGHSAKQIAYILNISTKTVEFHKARIMHQLGLTCTAELIRYAVEVQIRNRAAPQELVASIANR